MKRYRINYIADVIFACEIEAASAAEAARIASVDSINHPDVEEINVEDWPENLREIEVGELGDSGVVDGDYERFDTNGKPIPDCACGRPRVGVIPGECDCVAHRPPMNNPTPTPKLGTPLPLSYEYSPGSGSLGIHRIIDANGRGIGYTITAQDAAYIVRACNAHLAMVEALREVLAGDNTPGGLGGHYLTVSGDTMRRARAALALAEGKVSE